LKPILLDLVGLEYDTTETAADGNLTSSTTATSSESPPTSGLSTAGNTENNVLFTAGEDPRNAFTEIPVDVICRMFSFMMLHTKATWHANNQLKKY
jgi:hypothetical protein